jgi:hypothetical protein
MRNRILSKAVPAWEFCSHLKGIGRGLAEVRGGRWLQPCDGFSSVDPNLSCPKAIGVFKQYVRNLLARLRNPTLKKFLVIRDFVKAKR